MPELLQFVSEPQFLTSIGLIIGLLVLKVFFYGWIDGFSHIDASTKRRIKTNAKSAMWFAIVVALIFIWAPSLRSFALSLAAFSVAIIIATRELILCLNGYVFKATNKIAKIGARIELDKVKGEVIDQNVMTTVIAEIHSEGELLHFTGKNIIIPNSAFLSEKIKLLPSRNDYRVHRFSVYLSARDNPLTLKEKIDQHLSQSRKDFDAGAEAYKKKHENKYGVNLVNETVTSALRFLDTGKIAIDITILATPAHAAVLESQVLEIACEYLATVNTITQKIRD